MDDRTSRITSAVVVEANFVLKWRANGTRVRTETRGKAELLTGLIFRRHGNEIGQRLAHLPPPAIEMDPVFWRQRLS